MIKATLTMAGKEYAAEAENLYDALGELGISWEQVKAKGVIRVERDGKSYEHLFYIRPLKRIFVNKIARLMWAKRLELLLNEQ